MYRISVHNECLKTVLQQNRREKVFFFFFLKVKVHTVTVTATIR